MKLQFVWVGKTRKAAIKELVDDYLGRIGKFSRCEVLELRDRDDGGDAKRLIDREGEEILAKIGDDTFVVALDVKGRELDSFEFADFFATHQNRGTKQVAFVIGGYGGLAEAVRRRADLLFSLSRLTLTHELARIFLVEQVYRAFAILYRLPYQK